MVADEEVALSPREFALLEFLAMHAGEVVSRTTLLEHVWDQHYPGSTNVVDVYVSQIRRKLDGAGNDPLIPDRPRGRLSPRRGRLLMRSLRARLAVWSVLVLAGIVVLLGVFVTLRLRSDLGQRVDRSLDAGAIVLRRSFGSEGSTEFEIRATPSWAPSPTSRRPRRSSI